MYYETKMKLWTGKRWFFGLIAETKIIVSKHTTREEAGRWKAWEMRRHREQGLWSIVTQQPRLRRGDSSEKEFLLARWETADPYFVHPD